MRSREMKEEIMLIDHEGTERGVSKKRNYSRINNCISLIHDANSTTIASNIGYYMENKRYILKNKIAKISMNALIFFAS